MATAKQRLEYEVRLKDHASQAFRKMGKNAQTEATRAQKAFKGLGKAIKMVGLAVVAAFTAAAFKGMIDGARRAREFSKAMGEVSTILGEGSLSIGGATEKVKDLAMALGVPAPEIAAGLYQTLSAGVTDAAQAMTLLEGATRLGIAGLASTDQAVDLLTTAFNSYGMVVTDSAVASMSDMIFKTVQLGKTTIPELSASMGQVLPVAAQLGVDFEQVAAALASLTLKGLSTSEATTQLNAVFTAFLKKGDLANKTFGEGTNLMGAQAMKSKGLQQAMEDLMDAVGGNEDALIALTGRAEGAKAIMSLTADEGRVLTEQLEGISDAAGAADTAFGRMAETLDRKLKVAQEGITQGFAELVEGIVEMQMGATTFEEMTTQAEAFKSAIAGLMPIVNMIGLAVGIIMTGIIGVFAAVQSSIYLIGVALEEMGIIGEGTLDGLEESTMGMLVALTGSADMTQNFGRELIGLESNGFAATNAMAGLHQEMQEGHAGITAFNEDVVVRQRQILELMEAVRDGRHDEGELMGRIRRHYAYYVDRAERLNIELPRQVESWGAILERGTLFEQVVEEAADAVGDLTGEVEELLGAFDFSDLRAAITESTRFLQHDHEVRMMLMRDGEEKQIAMLEHRAEMEERAMQERVFNMGLGLEEALAMESEWREARQAQLTKEIVDLRLANAEKIRDAVETRDQILGLFGTDLAEELGGALGNISGFFEVSPVFNLENLRAQLVEARAEVEAALGAGLIDEAQAQGMLDMILNIETFKQKELEAAAATYEFKRSLEELGAVEAGVNLGLQNFADSVPELGDAMADVTSGALNNFSAGLTGALMSWADGSKSASEAFKDFAGQFLAQTASMIIQMLILQAIKAAVAFEKGGVIEGGTGSMTPLASGGVVAGGLGRAMPVRGYASGGPIVDSPHIALIGEGKQNEAVVPLPDGKSIPVNMTGGGGGASINFTINAVDARGVDELLVERQDTIRNLIRQAMAEDRVFRGSMGGA